MNWRGIVKTMASLEAVLGILMLSVPMIDVLTRRSISWWFLIPALIYILIGVEGWRISAEPLTLKDSLVVTAIAWPLISLESALSMMLTLGIDFVDAWFESISGFTGTGFTVLSGIDYMKPSIVTWRSIMQWSGELGFVVFAMVIFPYFYKIGRSAYGIERPLKIEASFYKTACSLIKIYVILTVAGLIAYIYAGMNLYEAFNHILTTIATGGMSTYDNGYMVIFERAPYTYIPVMVFMFLGGMNFILLYRLLQGDVGSVVRSEEFRAYTVVMVILSLALVASYIYVDGANTSYALVAAPFNLVSAMTTTGFNIGTISGLSDSSKAIIIVSMFVGGMIFSTAGGIKIYRLVILVKKFKYMALSSLVSIPVDKRTTVDGIVLGEEEVVQASVFTIFHATMIMIGAIIISAYGYAFIDALFEATSAAGCVGLSAGVVSASSPLVVKLVIMFLMITGRVEYSQLILILGYLVNRRALRVLR